MKRILVAMSGGVDSSVAAYLLKSLGHEVIGVSMHLVSCHRPTNRSCCSAEDRLDARRVCEALGIPHYTVDYREVFRQKVIQPFVAAYARGRTPIPCTSCNAELKFSALFDDMRRHGAGQVATGHYARLECDATGRYRLYRSLDPAKDQTYYLFQLTQRELAALSFPIGGFTKAEVRAIARAQGLVTQEKPESQEICFVADDDYVAFVEQHGSHLLLGEGDFVDRGGRVLGRHRGIHAYTIGQRRGLGVGFGRRMYVVDILPHLNQVVLGSKDEVMRSEMTVRGVSWLFEACDRPLSVRIRSQHTPAPADLEPIGERAVRVRFHTPQAAIAPGQAAVFYDGDELLGGGWIDA